MTTIRHVEAPTDADLEAAWATVAARLAPTPLVASELAPDAWLKLETMQPTGSFKVRGALAALSRLPAGHHVIAASAGNHGLAVAWAASMLGLTATVVVSEGASPAKIAKLRAQPIELILHGDTDAAEAYAPTLVRPGSTYVSPYNDTHGHRRPEHGRPGARGTDLGTVDHRRARRRWRPAGRPRALGAWAR